MRTLVATLKNGSGRLPWQPAGDDDLVVSDLRAAVGRYVETHSLRAALVAALLALAPACTVQPLRVLIPDFTSSRVSALRAYTVAGELAGEARLERIAELGPALWARIEVRTAGGARLRWGTVALAAVPGAPDARILRLALPEIGRACRIVSVNEAGESPPSLEAFPC